MRRAEYVNSRAYYQGIEHFFHINCTFFTAYCWKQQLLTDNIDFKYQKVKLNTTHIFLISQFHRSISISEFLLNILCSVILNIGFNPFN